MYTMYGHQVDPESDSFVKTAEEAVEMLINSMSPGAQIVNNFPFRESALIFTKKSPVRLDTTKCAIFLHGFQGQGSSDSLTNVSGS